jgi:ClpP class serine protease
MAKRPAMTRRKTLRVVEDDPDYMNDRDEEHRDPEARSAKFTAQGMLAIESKACDMDWAFEEPHQCEPQITEQAAIVTVRGPLNHHPDMRFDSYDKIVPRIEAAFASSAPGVLFSPDSPGGEVSGCFDTAAAIRALRVKYNKPLIGYVDGQASSAAYALLAACDYIVIPKEGVAGSIGVFSEVKSKARLNEAMGLDVEMIASGLRKLDGNPNVPITDEALANIQVGVMQQANVFWSWVSERRGIALDAVRAFEGRSYHGAQAVSMGLADAVGTYSDALAMVAKASATNAAQSGGETEGAEMSALRRMLLDEAAGDDDSAKRAKRALEAYDAEEESPPDAPPKKDGEPDGDEGRRAEDDTEDEARRAEEEVEAKKKAESRKATRAEDDDEAKRAESEEDEARRVEDDAKKAEDDAGEEDAKARSAMRAKAYDKAEEHMAAAAKLRNRATGLRSRAARCLKDAGIYRALAKSNALALETQKRLATSTTRTAARAATGAGTRGAGEGEPRTRASADDELPAEFVKAAGFGRRNTDTIDFEGEPHLALVSPAKAKEIYDATQAKISKLGGRS